MLQATCLHAAVHALLQHSELRGAVPIPDKINSYPSAIYTYVNYAAFRVFGFSQYTSSSVDLAIHFSVSTVAALALWRARAGGFSAHAVSAREFAVVHHQREAEELGILLAMTSLLTFQRGVGNGLGNR